jgi:hypothetical protein
MKTVWIFIVCLTGIVWFSSCHTCRWDDDDCPGDIACTEVFVTVAVPLEFRNLSIRDLAYSRTVRKHGGRELFRYEYNKPFDMGPYSAYIVNDSHLPDVQKSGTVVIYTLYDTSGEIVFEDEFLIGHDCCHVEKISGPDKIIL